MTFASRFFSRLRRSFGIHILRAFTRELGRASATSPRCPLRCRLLSEAEVLEWCRDPELELREAQVRSAYANGSLCLAAFADGSLVGYTWLAFRPTQLAKGVVVSFDERHRYSYKSFVREAWRGKRVIQALHRLADDPALRQGRSFAINFVNVDNVPNILALQRAGSRSAGFIGYVRCWGLMLTFSSPSALRCGVRLSGEEKRYKLQRLVASFSNPS